MNEEQLKKELYEALRKDDVDGFQLLINKARKDKQNIEDFISTSSSPENQTLLQCACNLEITKAVEILIKAKVNPNSTSKKNSTPPLFLAVEKGNLGILRLLASHKYIQLNVVDDPQSQQTVLHRLIALMGGESSIEEKSHYRQCFDYLLDTTNIILDTRNSLGNTPLHEAAYFGLQVAVIKLLLNGADPNLKGYAGQTVLHIWIDKPLRSAEDDEKRSRLMRCVRMLLERDRSSRDPSSLIDVNAVKENGRTPLHLAANCGFDDVVCLLLRNGADPNLKDAVGKTPLHELTSSFDLSSDEEEKERFLECLDILLDSEGRGHSPVDLEAKCSFDFTPLNYAIFSGVEEMVSKLLAKGANPNVKDEKGQTALHQVVLELGQACTTEDKHGYGECLDALLEEAKSPAISIDVNSQDDKGDTALHLAIRYGLGEAISKLCSNKDVDFSIKNNQGWTVLHEVVHPKAFNSCPIIRKNRSKYFEIILSSIESNQKIPIDVNALDSEGNTLLHYAILSGFEEAVVRLLLDGAQPSAATCRMILPSTWETFMDSCITLHNEEEISSMNFPVTFDYSHLVAPLTKPSVHPRKSISQSVTSLNSTVASLGSPTGNSITLKSLVSTKTSTTNSTGISIPIQSNSNVGVIHPECELLWHLSRSPKYQNLMKHPLVTSFLLQKWHRIRLSYFFRLFVHAVYLALFTAYLVIHVFVLTMTGKRSDDPVLDTLEAILFLMSAMLILRSTAEFFISPGIFLLKIENWIGLIVQGLTFYLVTSGKVLPLVGSQCAVIVLFAWTHWLILLSRHPKLSMYVTMFRTVSLTFLRLLVWYSSLLFGFALAFFCVFDLKKNTDKAIEMMKDKGNKMEEESLLLFKKEFQTDMLTYFLRVLVMMTGEQDFGNLRSEGHFNDHPWTSRLIFLAFLFLITIVLFSLLNAMAVSDIRDIRTKAEIFYFSNLAKSLAIREALVLGDPCKILPGWTIFSCCWRSYSNPSCFTRPILRRLLLFYDSPSATSTFKLESENFSLGSREWIMHFMSSWRTFFYDSSYQLDEEIIRSAQQKVLENRKRSEKEARNYEIDSLRGDIQEILNFLKPSRDMIPEENTTEAEQQKYKERRKTMLIRRKRNHVSRNKSSEVNMCKPSKPVVHRHLLSP